MKQDIERKLKNYLEIFSEADFGFGLLKEQFRQGQDVVSRKNFFGHVTASGIVVTPDKKVLVIFHKQLQKFLQPGGHLEITDSGLVNAAQREISEETGLKDPCLHDWCLRNDAPLFIDTHPIPANQAKNEDKHFHHDFMFLFIADTKIVNLDQQEVSEAKWLDTSSLLNANSTVAQALLRATKLGII